MLKLNPRRPALPANVPAAILLMVVLCALSAATHAGETSAPPPASLAYDLSVFDHVPNGLEIAQPRGRKLTLPVARPIMLEHETRFGILVSTGSRLTLKTPCAKGTRVTWQVAISPAGSVDKIASGQVHFLARWVKDGKELHRVAKQIIGTRAGEPTHDSWTALPREGDSACPEDGALLEIETQAFDAEGKLLPSTPDQLAPLGVMAYWGDLRLLKPRGENAPPSVVLIAFDTLRADRLNCYGYKERTLSPMFDALAERGYLFEKCFSPTSWTLPAFQSMLSGLHPAQLGYGREAAHNMMEDNLAKLRYGRSATLPHVFRAGAGHYTAASTGGGMMEPWQNGFLKGFAYYWANPSLEPARQGPLASTEAQANVLALRRQLHEADGAPLFAFYHTYEPHTPYQDTRFTKDLRAGRVTAPFGEGKYLPGYDKVMHADLTDDEKTYVGALYDGDIGASDDALQKLWATLQAHDLPDRAWIVITSDHGEEFWEHGGMSHGHSLYDELLHVPLIVIPPGGLKKGVRIDTPVSLLDLFPTLCALGRQAAPENLLGRDLSPLLTEDADKRAAVKLPEPAGLFVACGVYHGPTRWAVRHGRYKYIQSVGVEVWKKDERNRKALRLVPEELFDLQADPGEQKNLIGDAAHAQTHKDMVERLKVLMESVLKPIPLNGAKLEPPPIDPAYQEKLKKLGY